MLRGIFTVIMTVTFFSCAQKETKLPFSEDKTVRILADMYIMEAAMTGKRNEEADSLREHYQELLIQEYQIDSMDLFTLSEYLENHPEQSQELHDRARNRIDHMQRTVN